MRGRALNRLAAGSGVGGRTHGQQQDAQLLGDTLKAKGLDAIAKIRAKNPVTEEAQELVGTQAPGRPAFQSYFEDGSKWHAKMAPKRPGAPQPKGYCWRFAGAQLFGMPREVFDNVLQTLAEGG